MTFFKAMRPCMTRRRMPPGKQRLGLLSQSVFGLRSQLNECCHVVDRQLRKHLPIDDDSRLFQAVHEETVRHTAGSCPRVNSGDPQTPKIPLLTFSIDIRPRKRVEIRLSRSTVYVLFPSPVSLGYRKKFFPLFITCATTFDAGHRTSPLSLNKLVLSCTGEASSDSRYGLRRHTLFCAACEGERDPSP